MGVRVLRKGSKGEDVRVVQRALNRNGAKLDADGDFGNHTKDAVIGFQRWQRKKNPRFQVDGEVGDQTRRALFPLFAVTVTVQGVRVSQNSGSKIGFGLPPLDLTLPPLLNLTPQLVHVPGLLEPIAAAPVAGAVGGGGSSSVEWQQFAQTQRQFTGLFDPADSFAVGIQTVFLKSDNDNHVEFTTGCLLQSPIGFKDAHGNDFTLGCFANATWVDPILHFGMFHLANPYAQTQFQGNLTGPATPTAQLGVFPVNINVDLDDQGLQLNFSGGASWSLVFDQTGITSSWGPAFGIGLVGKFRRF